MWGEAPRRFFIRAISHLRLAPGGPQRASSGRGFDLSAKKTRSRRWTWLLASIVGVVIILGGTWVGAHFAAGDQVPTNSTVEGVAIGGLGVEQAEEKLREELEPQYSAPVSVSAPDVGSATLQPLEAGLTLDHARAVRSAGGGSSWNPVDIWRTFTGGEEVELPRSVDEEQLRAALEEEAGAFERESSDATLAFDEGSIVRTDGVPATELDVDQTLPALSEALMQGETVVEAVVAETPPAVTTAMVDEAVGNYAEPAVSGPVTLTGPNGSFQITPGQIAAVTTFVVQDGALVPQTDVDALMELTAQAQSGLNLAVTKNASYALSSGVITVVPAVDGSSVDPDNIAAAMWDAAVKTGEERTAAIEVIKETAEFTTAEAAQLKPTTVIGEFSTRYPHAAYRNTNLGQAAESINGTVLMPGEVFSLNETLGPRTAANGYVDGYVINEGVLVEEPGGGISQSSTTLFNAAFFAGYDIVEHKPHSLYFARYPAGREATIYYGALDMRFRNNTDYPAYIQGYINRSSPGNRGTITFKIFSQKTWDKVESTELRKSGFYNGTTRTLDTPDCEPQAPIQGFTVNWQRLFYKDGAVAKSEDWSWKYSAGDRIVCE